jgi:hypothetical protein
MGGLLRAFAVVVAGCCVVVSLGRAAIVPVPVVDAVHGRLVGWANGGSDWFVVYLSGNGRGWCGFDGAAWHTGLVERRLPQRLVADRRLGRAMCGNSLAWVRTGRFSDGRHQEAAFMLWTTPSIGAWTYIYRLSHDHLRLLARFYGDRVTLRPGTVTVEFENRGRSPRGDLKDVYRFTNGRYRLAHRS